ncbi:TPA: hypothetical protein N0F65_012323 [Lagenidium giganteum]|uniref:3'-5' exonuclease domain-containing protein n=1 Tax=Lagenidium giganteum TaxID=4803 RepID=A0AAV2YSP4_9STRA|nr:TPA: hypothetical protein N0F65_012323 [Lagenidium giganteum]
MVTLVDLINQAPPYVIPDVHATVHFVGTAADWLKCAPRLKKARVVGLDTETRPVFQKGRDKNPCSLLQIAVRDAQGKEEVFVIDLLHLQPKVYNTVLSEVFLSRKIIKLGQGWLHDMKELNQCYPKASCFKVAKRVVEVNDMSISLMGGHHPISLQKLTFHYLNKKLTKTQQMSNWNRRPLAPSQLHYAASDALVLIHLYDELMRRLTSKNKAFNIDSIANVLDVDMQRTLKCTLCFTVADNAADYKRHRKECSSSALSLRLCNSCGDAMLKSDVHMNEHMAACSGDQPNTAPAVAPEAPQQPKEKKRKKKSAKIQLLPVLLEAASPVNVEMEEQQPSPAQQSKRAKRKQKKKKNKAKAVAHTVSPTLAGLPLSKRKMSADSAFLASDDIWSLASSDNAASMLSPW